MDLYNFAVVLHVIGAVIGVGTVTVHDLQFYRAIGDRDLAAGYQKSVIFYGKLIHSGLFLLVISGLYFMIARPAFWNSEKILTKLGLLVVLIVNGFLINNIFHPKFARLKMDDWLEKSPAFKKLTLTKLPIDAISIATWYAIVFLGAAGRQPWNPAQIIIGYAVFLMLTYIIIRTAVIKRLTN